MNEENKKINKSLVPFILGVVLTLKMCIRDRYNTDKRDEIHNLLFLEVARESDSRFDKEDD